MSCQNGYIEINGDCIFAFGNESGVGPDGTPLPEKKNGGFWDWVKNNLPDILVGAGTVLESTKNKPQPTNPTPTPPTPGATNSKMPVWAWILIAVAVLVLLVLLFRSRPASV